MCCILWDMMLLVCLQSNMPFKQVFTLLQSTADNISRYREQLDKIGFSFDWSREVQTSDPELLQMDAMDLSCNYSIIGTTIRMKAKQGQLDDLVEVSSVKRAMRKVNAANSQDRFFFPGR